MSAVRAIGDAVKSFLDSGPGMPGLLIYLAAACVPVALLHELGHAIAAARRLGAPVHVSPGGTGQLVRVRLRRLTLAVHALPQASSASGFASVDAARATARDVMQIALAGPAASLLGLIVASIACASTPKGVVVHNLFWAIALVSLVGILNLLPLQFGQRAGGSRLRSDGRLLLEAARAKRSFR